MAPTVALHTEQQLKDLVLSVRTGRQWTDPADVIDPDGEKDFDSDALINLAQSRIVHTKGGDEALNIVLMRLLAYVGVN